MNKNQAAVLLQHAVRQDGYQPLYPAVLSQRAGGLYFHRPQRHDAGAEEAAGGRHRGSGRPEGDTAGTCVLKP